MKRFLLILVVLQVGCAKIPAIHHYTLLPSARTPSIAEYPGEGLVIGVGAFLVDPPYDQDRIVYRNGQGNPEIGFYAYHRWAAPLSLMLPIVVSHALESIPGLAVIEPISSVKSYDAFLDGRLLFLEEVDTDDGYEARVGLRLDVRSADGEPLWTVTVEGVAVTGTPAVEAVVDKMRQAIATALENGREELATAIAAGRVSPKSPGTP